MTVCAFSNSRCQNGQPANEYETNKWLCRISQEQQQISSFVSMLRADTISFFIINKWSYKKSWSHVDYVQTRFKSLVWFIRIPSKLENEQRTENLFISVYQWSKWREEHKFCWLVTFQEQTTQIFYLDYPKNHIFKAINACMHPNSEKNLPNVKFLSYE